MNKFNFNKLTPFKWFVLENFPFIEADFDALTEWQLFCKLGKEMNKIINSENTLGTQMENVTNAFIDLQNYIDNYFDNLDVQDEINNKLNEMAEDGTLTNIIASYVQPFIEEQNENISSLENQIIVERNRINNIVSLPEGSTTGDAELTDIRIAFNGLTYNTAGEAVRTQVENIYNDLIVKTEQQQITSISNRVLGAYNSNGNISNFGYRYQPIQITKGTQYRVMGGSNRTYPLYVITDLQNNVLNFFRYSATDDYKFYNIENSFVATEDGYLLINTFPDQIGDTVAYKTINTFPKDVINNITNTNNFIINNWENDVRQEQLKNDFAWKQFNKVYVSIVIDDNPKDISAFQNLFAQENVPLCLAAPPSTLENICLSGNTVKTVMQNVVLNGGEILTHGFNPLTSSSSNADYIEKIITAKKILFENGFTDINGIITIGGSNYLTANFEKCVELMRPYYKYSDLYGTGTNVIQYYHPRKALGYNINGNRNDIANAITDFNNTGVGSWVVVYCHGTRDLVQNGSADNNSDVENAVLVMKDLIDWIKSKSECEIVTYKNLYDRFKSSKLENRISSLEN